MSSAKAPHTAAVVLLLTMTCASPVAARGLFGRKPVVPALAKAAPSVTTAPAKPVKATAEQRAVVERMDPLARAAFWAREVDADPADLDATVRMAAALRGLERYDEAAAALDKVLVAKPDHLEALLEAGRTRVSAARGFYAIDFLKRAAALAPRDWRPHSLLGVAMEQTKRPEDAQAEYARALQLSPENPAVLSNLALLAANNGDKAQAESLLRRAVAQPTATSRERQNLALVLGLAGKVDEAERLIRRDLPPEVADANIAYLESRGRPLIERRGAKPPRVGRTPPPAPVPVPPRGEPRCAPPARARGRLGPA